MVEGCRAWRKLDIPEFRAALSTSKLCQPKTWPADIDEMAMLYDDELETLLDGLLPSRPLKLQKRASDSWFDQESRSAKRLTRRLERAYAAACRRSKAAVSDSSTAKYNHSDAALDVAAAKDDWYAQRRSYRSLLRQKCSRYWSETVEEQRANPVKLWQSVDKLLGRSRVQVGSSIDVETFSKFLLIRLRGFVRLPLKRLHRRTPASARVHRCRDFVLCQPMTSSTRSNDCRINRRLPIHFRRQF